ncbi:MAG: hypothetical protein FH748_16930 [Balneolaceae bacterium]|nr:hypothetical protein [Balneolaceae bacterium]
MGRIKDFFGTGKDAAKKIARYLIQLSIVGYLIYQLQELGLQTILESLPRNPLFYVLYLLIYFSLPVMEVFIYRIKWSISFRSSISVFIQKKVLNTDVVGYSGELYLYYWAKTNLEKTSKQVFNFVKDNNILSSIASTLITLVLLFFFVTQGYINIDEYLGDVSLLNWVFIILIVTVTGFLVYKFRSAIFSMNRNDSIKIFLLHSLRIIAINVLQIIQWKVGQPDIDYTVWFTFSAVLIVSTRIPFMPSADALFTTIAMEMSNIVSVPTAAYAGILTANLILKRVLNLVSYMASSYFQDQHAVEVSDEDIAEFKSMRGESNDNNSV